MAYIFRITKQKTQYHSIYNQKIAREGKGKGAFLPPNPPPPPFRQLLRRQANFKERCKWGENENGTKFLA